MLRLVVAASLMVTSTSIASAAIINEGNGDWAVKPFYKSDCFGMIDVDADWMSLDVHAHFYQSNLVPKYITNSVATLSANGAIYQGALQTVAHGFFAARNYAEMTVTGYRQADNYYSVAGTGSASSIRFFTDGAYADRAVFRWRVSGTSQTSIPGVGAVSSRLDFGASTNPAVNWYHLFEDESNLLNSITNFGPGIYTYTLPNVMDTNISLLYWSSAFISAKDGSQLPPEGSSVTFKADYSNTYVLEEVQLLDVNGDRLTGDWVMRDLESGLDVFDQNGRLQALPSPPPLPSAVPEPASLGLWLMGVVGLGLLRAGRCA
jgi:hypothetical protein